MLWIIRVVIDNTNVQALEERRPLTIYVERENNLNKRHCFHVYGTIVFVKRQKSFRYAPRANRVYFPNNYPPGSDNRLRALSQDRRARKYVKLGCKLRIVILGPNSECDEIESSERNVRDTEVDDRLTGFTLKYNMNGRPPVLPSRSDNFVKIS